MGQKAEEITLDNYGIKKVLTTTEVIDLGRKVQAMNEVEKKGGAVTSQDEIIIQEGKDAYETLIRHHINYAYSIAHRHHNKVATKYEKEDLLQDAIVALLESIHTYDPDMGTKLITHAHFGITKKVTTSINYNRLVRLPENRMGDYLLISNAQKEYEILRADEKEQYQNQMDYVYKTVNVAPEIIDIILNNMQPVASLNSPLYEEEGELINTLVDNKAEAEVVEYGNLDERLNIIFQSLEPYERTLISFEYGIINDDIELEKFTEKHNLQEEKAWMKEVRRITKKMKILGESMIED